MKQSISYYLTLWVIKLKGIKKTLSKSPVDVQKMRKEDVHQPKGKFFKQHARTFQVLDSVVTEVAVHKNAKQLLLFIHGGAFISGPAPHHWDTTKTIAQKTQHTIWMCDYPKAPEHKIGEMAKNIDAVYAQALEHYEPHNIIIIGDSAGGSLAASLTQRLVANGSPLPKKLILVSPVMDASMSNPAIAALDTNDPMLSKPGVLSAKQMCAGEVDLQDPMMSPLHGSFEGFPPTALFLGGRDIMYADEKLAEAKMKDAGIDLQVFEGENMPHIWPLLPVMKEAKVALNQIIGEIGN